MRLFISFFISLNLGVFLDCKTENKKEILVVDSDAIIFISISQKEYNDLHKNEKAEVDEALADLHTYYERIEYFFSKTNVKVLLVAENKIIFITSKMQRVTFRRSMKKQIVGIILFHPDKQPLIMYGVFTDTDILDKIKEYHAEWVEK